MDAGKISVNNTINRPKVIKKKASGLSLPADSFQKSENTAPDKLMELKSNTAARILMPTEGKVTLKDPFGFKADNYRVSAAVTDPGSGTYYVGLMEKNSKKYYLASYNADRTLKWKKPVDKPLYNIVPDSKGGVIGRFFEKIYAFDDKGEVSWEYSPKGATREYADNLKVGSDGTVYYVYGNSKSKGKDENRAMTVAAVKDGKLKWNYKCGSFPTRRMDLEVDDQGGVYFTSPENMAKDSLLDKLKGGGEKKFCMIALDSKGNKKFEKVTGDQWLSAKPVQTKDGSLVYISDWGFRVSSMSPDGEEKWSIKLDGRIKRKPAVNDNGELLLAMNPSDGSSGKNRVVCLDEKKGEIKWQGEFEGDIKSSPMMNGNDVYVKTFTGSKGIKFYKFSDEGRQVEKIGFTSLDDDSLIYLDDKNVVVGRGDDQVIRPLYSFSSEEEVSRLESSDDSSEKPEIKQEEDSVLIGGVRLKKRQ